MSQESEIKVFPFYLFPAPDSTVEEFPNYTLHNVCSSFEGPLHQEAPLQAI